MIGAVVMSHGLMGVAMVEALEQALGPQAGILPFVWDSADCMDDKYQKLTRLAAEADTGDGVIGFIDMKGGTPANLCLQAVQNDVLADFVSGMNLPMLVKFVEQRENLAIGGLAQACAESGRKYIGAPADLRG